jgi:hypothetical protein
MNVKWRSIKANEWMLQLHPEWNDRIHVCRVIRYPDGRQIPYHATIYASSIEHDDDLLRDKVRMDKEVIEVARELIANHNDFWYNSYNA